VIIDDILKRELVMFAGVRIVTLAQSRETPNTFGCARRTSLEVLSSDTLKAYHGDLLEAERAGLNLIELRYGRMNNLVGCLNINPMIDEIIDIETRWVRELGDRYPGVSAEALDSGAMFPLRCELETFSDRTLESYYDDVLAADAVGRNLAEERYDRARAH